MFFIIFENFLKQLIEVVQINLDAFVCSLNDQWQTSIVIYKIIKQAMFKTIKLY